MSNKKKRKKTKQNKTQKNKNKTKNKKQKQNETQKTKTKRNTINENKTKHKIYYNQVIEVTHSLVAQSWPWGSRASDKKKHNLQLLKRIVKSEKKYDFFFDEKGKATTYNTVARYLI